MLFALEENWRRYNASLRVACHFQVALCVLLAILMLFVLKENQGYFNLVWMQWRFYIGRFALEEIREKVCSCWNNCLKGRMFLNLLNLGVS